MAAFSELHVKTLLAIAGVPVVSANGTDDRRPPIMAAIYLPPGSSVEASGVTTTYRDGVFAYSKLERESSFTKEVGFAFIYKDPFFERNFRLSDSSGYPVAGEIDRSQWAERTIAAVKQLREAGFSTMPEIETPSAPGQKPVMPNNSNQLG